VDEVFFRRQKEVRIGRLADDRYRLEGELRDDFHEIRAAVVVEYPSLTILEVEGEMVRGTNPPFCAGATQVLGGLVGERIHRGFVKVVAEKVGGRYGCPHLMEVVTDIGRAAFQIHMANLRQRARESPELARLLAEPLLKRRFALQAMPRLADSCWVFNTDNDARFERQWRERQAEGEA
jgi:hypothetical protein